MRIILQIVLLTIYLSNSFGGNMEFPDELKDVIQYIHDVCVERTGVAEEDISNCEKGIFSTDRKLKCYMFCLYEESSFVGDDDLIDFDILISMIPESFSDKCINVINACRDQDLTGKERCERAYDTHLCFYQKSPETYFLF